MIHHISGKLEVGEILLLSDYMSNMAGKKDEVNIHVSTTEILRRSFGYKKFYLDLIDKLIPSATVHWRSNTCNKRQLQKEWVKPSLPKQGHIHHYTEAELKYRCMNHGHLLKYIEFPNISDKLVQEDYEIGGSYAVITTRARVGMSLNAYRPRHSELHRCFEKFAQKAFQKLVERYDKVVIVGGKREDIGEKETGDKVAIQVYDSIVDTPEYTSDRVVDMTNTRLDLETFYQDNTLCKNAARVVTFGNGGNFVTQLYLKSKHHALMSYHEMEHPLMKHPLMSKVYTETELKDFYQSI